jgi:hypothetical protein
MQNLMTFSVLDVMLSTFASLSVNSAKHPCVGDFQRIMGGIPHFVRNDKIGIVFLCRLSPSKLHQGNAGKRPASKALQNRHLGNSPKVFFCKTQKRRIAE